MTLSVRKIFIDSRFLVSGDSSRFRYELPEVVELPPDTVAFVTEFTTCASWDTVSPDRNDILYVVEQASSTFKARAVTVAAGAYDSETLRVALESALNGATKMVDGFYSVSRASSAGTSGTTSIGAAYRYYTVTLTGGGLCFFPPDKWLRENPVVWVQYGGGLYDRENPRSTNELFQFPKMGFATFHTSSFLDLRSIHTLFCHSPSFGNYSCLAPRGVRTAICKVPCTGAYGSVLTYEHSGSQYDYIDVGTTTLKMLTFELKDARGNLVDLRGGHWSMTLVLARK
jgi:hypothetical protein